MSVIVLEMQRFRMNFLFVKVLICLIPGILAHLSLSIRPALSVIPKGRPVEFLCQANKELKAIEWMKLNDFLSDRNMRFRMFGNNTDTFKFAINPALEEDEGWYKCRAYDERRETYVYSAYSELEVIVPPKPPKIYLGSKEISQVLFVKSGEELKLNCSSIGGKPPPRVFWWSSLEGELHNHFTEIIHLEGGYMVNSILNLKTGRRDHNRTLKCFSENNDIYPSKSALVVLYLDPEPLNEEESKTDSSVHFFLAGTAIFGAMAIALTIAVIYMYRKTLIECCARLKNAETSASDALLDESCNSKPKVTTPAKTNVFADVESADEVSLAVENASRFAPEEEILDLSTRPLGSTYVSLSCLSLSSRSALPTIPENERDLNAINNAENEDSALKSYGISQYVSEPNPSVLKPVYHPLKRTSSNYSLCSNCSARCAEDSDFARPPASSLNSMGSFSNYGSLDRKTVPLALRQNASRSLSRRNSFNSFR